MAWRCSGRTNAELVANLKRAQIIKSDRVEHAMLAVDRKAYVARGNPYEDRPLSIGSNVTISAPHIVRDEDATKLRAPSLRLFLWCRFACVIVTNSRPAVRRSKLEKGFRNTTQ